jgi:hypothetical protein
MIYFVLLNTYFNSQKNIIPIDPTLEADKVPSNGKLSGDYVQNRLKRYFDVTVPNRTVHDFVYDNGYYYFPAADGEQHDGFSKVTSMTKTDNGEWIVTYDVYTAPDFVDGIGTNASIYYGYGSENTEGCRLVATGKAVLKEKYFKEDYANVTVVSMEHTETQPY